MIASWAEATTLGIRAMKVLPTENVAIFGIYFYLPENICRLVNFPLYRRGEQCNVRGLNRIDHAATVQR